jgi:hypothetical protein
VVQELAASYNGKVTVGRSALGGAEIKVTFDPQPGRPGVPA